MPFHALADAIRTHHGEFLCRSHGDATRRKTVPFRHLIAPPDAATLSDVPAVGGLNGFYAVCNSVTFYHDETSGEAAEVIADRLQVAAHAALFADVNFGGLCIGLQQLDCEWDIEDADATAAAIPTRYQVTYRTLVHDLTAQG